MNIRELNNKIVIVKNGLKKRLLELINHEKGLLNIKIIEINDFINKYTFTYNNKAVFYVMNKYNVIYDIAKIYLENIRYVSKGVSDKTDFLFELKKDLDDNNYLIYNDNFKEYLNGKDIVIIDFDYVDNYLKLIFKELEKNCNVSYLSVVGNNYHHKVYELNNKDEEIAFVASSIAKLINNGIDINQIKIANLNKDYIFSIIKIFKLFGIPVEIPSFESCKGTIIVQKFKEFFSNDIDSVIKHLKDYARDEFDIIIFNKIINILNEYSWSSDYNDCREMIFNEVDGIKLEGTVYDNAIRVVDICDTVIDDSEYVFLINFNDGSFPINYKDEEFLSDKEKEGLNLSTSYMLNKANSDNNRCHINNIKNLVITYSKNNLSNELYISSLFDDTSMELIKNIKNEYNFSNNYNMLKLVGLKDDYKKFGTINNDLVLLANNYHDASYCSYNNEFNGISTNNLNNYLNNKLSLSYTTMNTYYNCSFRYYLDNILRLNKYEDNFGTIIGNIFHKVLSECFIDNYDFDKRYFEIINELNYDFDSMEKYFINKLKGELLLIIDTIKEQLSFISLKKSLYEKEVIININGNSNITFKGFIDKILYDEVNNENIAIIIDYKTGNPPLNIDNAIYGLDLQLPVYVYLLKESNIIENVRVGGFYLQKILTNKNNIKEKKDSLKLQGYSNSSIDVLKYVDSSYLNSNIIKSLRMTNNGFYAYSKVLTDSHINNLSKLVSNKICEASDGILNGKFDINPKNINQVLVGCEYCKYKDICYMTKKDEVLLKKMKKEDFLGGE